MAHQANRGVDCEGVEVREIESKFKQREEIDYVLAIRSSGYRGCGYGDNGDGFGVERREIEFLSFSRLGAILSPRGEKRCPIVQTALEGKGVVQTPP